MAKSIDTIQIQFKASGNQALTAAVRALDNATRSLTASAMSSLKVGSSKIKDALKQENAQSRLNEATRAGTHNLRNIHDQTSKTGTAFSVFRSKLLLATFAIGLMKQTVGKLMGLYDDMVKQQIKINTHIKTTGAAANLTSRELFKLADRLQDVTLVSNDLILEGQSMLLTFTKIRGEAFERTLKAALDLSTGFGQDLRQSIIQVGKAINDPILGFTALRRVGVSFSETQKTMIKDLVAQNRLFEAQKIILDELEMEVGGVTEAMNKAPLAGWKKGWNDLLDSMKEVGAFLEIGFRPLESLWGTLTKGFKDITHGAKVWANSVKGIDITKFEATKDRMDFINIALGDVQGSWDDMNDVQKQWATDAGLSIESLTHLASLSGKSSTGFLMFKDALEEARQKLEQAVVSSKKLGDWEKIREEIMISSAEKSNERWTETLKQLDDAITHYQKLEEAEAKLDKRMKDRIFGEKIDFTAAKAEGDITGQLDQSLEIRAQHEQKAISMKQQAFDESTQLFSEGLMTEQEAYQQYKERLLDIDKWYQEQKLSLDAEEKIANIEKWTEAGEMALQTMDRIISMRQTQLDVSIHSDLEELKATTKYNMASRDSQIQMEKDVKNEHHKQRVSIFRMEKSAAISDIIMNFATAHSKTFAQLGLLGGLASMPLLSGLMALQIGLVLAQPKPQKFAKGGEFITDRPEMIIVGEAGRERVSITPIDRPDDRALGGGSVTVNFSGNVLSQNFIEDEAIPAIREAIRRGADIGIT